MKCERCGTETEEPALILLKLHHWGLDEKRWLLCKFCVALIELTLGGSGGKNIRA